MKIGIVGSGIVGKTLGSGFILKGHQVMIGSRSTQNEKVAAWLQKMGANASQGNFEDAAKFGELVINCTSGEHSLEALATAGSDNLNHKVLIDVSNPLDFSKGMPPTLFLVNDTSLGESIQNKFPQTKVVKVLNTITASLMVAPAKIANGDHNLFMCGNDDEAKRQVKELLHDNFNWSKENIIDLGDVTNSRGTEQLLSLWIRLMGVFGTADFNFKIVK